MFQESDHLNQTITVRKINTVVVSDRAFLKIIGITMQDLNYRVTTIQIIIKGYHVNYSVLYSI